MRKKPTAIERVIGSGPRIPEAIEAAITRPHEHEGKANPPLWLIWRVDKHDDGSPVFPVLDTVSDSARSARYHVGMILDDNQRRKEGRSGQASDVYVERIPANHRFGSSLPELQMRGYQTIRAFRKRHQLDGE